MKVYEVYPGLFVRGHLRRLRGPGALKDFLKRNSIDVVASTVKPYMRNVDRLVQTYLWHPVRDGKLARYELRILEVMAEEVAKQVRKGRRVIIHCNRGRNRSCFVAAMAVSLLKGVTGSQAIKHVRKMRPNSLSNKYFVKHLEGYDGRYIKRHRNNNSSR